MASSRSRHARSIDGAQSIGFQPSKTAAAPASSSAAVPASRRQSRARPLRSAAARTTISPPATMSVARKNALAGCVRTPSSLT
jgi:hypothetical protein